MEEKRTAQNPQGRSLALEIYCSAKYHMRWSCAHSMTGSGFVTVVVSEAAATGASHGLPLPWQSLQALWSP